MFPVQVKIGDETFGMDEHFVRGLDPKKLEEIVTLHHLNDNDIDVQEFHHYCSMASVRGSWYSNYKHQCAGRVIHFLFVYCGLSIADICQIGAGEVIYLGKKLASFTWDGNLPIFEFTKETNTLNEGTLRHISRNQSIYHKYLKLEKYFQLPNDIERNSEESNKYIRAIMDYRDKVAYGLFEKNLCNELIKRLKEC